MHTVLVDRDSAQGLFKEQDAGNLIKNKSKLNKENEINSATKPFIFIFNNFPIDYLFLQILRQGLCSLQFSCGKKNNNQIKISQIGFKLENKLENNLNGSKLVTLVQN